MNENNQEINELFEMFKEPIEAIQSFIKTSRKLLKNLKEEKLLIIYLLLYEHKEQEKEKYNFLLEKVKKVYGNDVISFIDSFYLTFDDIRRKGGYYDDREQKE